MLDSLSSCTSSCDRQDTVGLSRATEIRMLHCCDNPLAVVGKGLDMLDPQCKSTQNLIDLI